MPILVLYLTLLANVGASQSPCTHAFIDPAPHVSTVRRLSSPESKLFVVGPIVLKKVSTSPIGIGNALFNDKIPTAFPPIVHVPTSAAEPVAAFATYAVDSRARIPCAITEREGLTLITEVRDCELSAEDVGSPGENPACPTGWFC